MAPNVHKHQASNSFQVARQVYKHWILQSNEKEKMMMSPHYLSIRAFYGHTINHRNCWAVSRKHNATNLPTPTCNDQIIIVGKPCQVQSETLFRVYSSTKRCSTDWNYCSSWMTSLKISQKKVNFCGTIELSYNSTGLLVGSWLLWIQHFSFAVSFGACLELAWRFEQRTIYISSLRATMSLDLDEVV